MIYCKELDQDFETKEAMFKALKFNEGNIINLKKAAISKSCEKGQFSPSLTAVKLNDATKAEFNLKQGYVYPVINTTKYMDSHSDVHFDGIWNKSIKEQKGSIFYVADHSLKVGDVIAWPEDVKAFVKNIPWSMVGKDFEGETQALIYEIPTSKIVNDAAAKAINEGKAVQNSVRMQYVKITFAVDSQDKDYAVNKAYFDAKIDSIANKEEVMEQGYFWGVEEAKIHKEGSMVLFGSNDATPILQSNTEPPAKGTQEAKEVEPSNSDTQKDFINEINNFKFL
jgi:hypothetical protein